MAAVSKRNWTYKGEPRESWVLRYTDLRGKRRLKTFTQKKYADRFRIKVEGEIERGVHVADSASITVRHAAKLFLENCDRRRRKGDMKRSTVVGYHSYAKNHVLPGLGAVRLTRLSAPVVQEWVNDCVYDEKDPKSSDTMKHALQTLSSVLTHAQRLGYISENVIKDARPEMPAHSKKQIEIPTRDEVRALLAAAKGMARPIMHVAVLTGMRAGEISGLKWGDIDFDDKLIRVRRSMNRWAEEVPPKSEAGNRDIPMAPVLVNVLKTWKLETAKNERDLVFATRTGRPVLPGQLYGNYWMPLSVKLGLAGDKVLYAHEQPAAGGRSWYAKPKYHFHALRHVAASLFIEQGLLPKRIQHIMGHASIQITFDRYGHLFEDDDAAQTAAVGIEKSLGLSVS